MAKTVFLSHAGGDVPKAATVARLLTEAGITVRYDRQELNLGDSFLSFMENAISESDYCLLLWSQSAAATPWVKLEWENALYRSVQEKRSFLVVGRLEDVAPPALLNSRLRVDFFPGWQPGLGRVTETWKADRAAEAQTQRPVASAASANTTSGESPTVYVSSDEFGITVPLQADLEAPAGVYLDRIISDLRLPKVLEHEGRVWVRFTYRLMNGREAVDRALPLSAQNIKDKSVLWLETKMTPFSQSEPIAGTLTSAVFRGPPASASAEEIQLRARREYLAALKQVGLGLRH